VVVCLCFFLNHVSGQLAQTVQKGCGSSALRGFQDSDKSPSN